MKKLLLLVAVSCVFTIQPALAEATCTLSGVIARITVAADGGQSTFHLRTSFTSPLYSAVSGDAKILSVATTALTHQTRVTVYGNAATCPPSGGPIGGITRLNLNP